MCGVCGCGGGGASLDDGKGDDAAHHRHHNDHDHDHDHEHDHEHDHGHEHEHVGPDGTVHHHDHHHHPDPHTDRDGGRTARLLRVEQDILAKNNAYAAANRELFAAAGVFSVNLMSSPGAGKTTLLVRTLTEMKGRFPAAVIEGDQQTSVDADRIRATGTPAIQVNTGTGCHLDALMVTRAVGRLGLTAESLLFIENVGNLVCPAGFDLGEARRVVVLSTTEGEDKPLKYPNMVAAADLLLVNKIDLLPHLTFDVGRLVDYARRIKPGLEVMEVSASTGVGLDRWYQWLETGLAVARRSRETGDR